MLLDVGGACDENRDPLFFERIEAKRLVGQNDLSYPQIKALVFLDR
jgi:hypothetical protein